MEFEGTGLCLGPQLNPKTQLSTCTQLPKPCPAPRWVLALQFGEILCLLLHSRAAKNQLFVPGNAILFVSITQVKGKPQQPEQSQPSPLQV